MRTLLLAVKAYVGPVLVVVTIASIAHVFFLRWS
jgi:hypothetical protein